MSAQLPRSQWMVRAGFLQSRTVLTDQSIPITVPFSYLGLKPLNSYFLGVRYTRRWAILGVSAEVNYARKGVVGINPGTGRWLSTNPYHYAGILPTIDLQLKNLTVGIGPEINFLVAGQSAFQHANPVEWGVSGRVSYSFNKFGLVAGFNHPFTYADYTGTRAMPVYYYKFITWHLGATFSLLSS